MRLFVMQRREYNIQITVNGHQIKKVVIDPHYELKHSKYVNDEVIVQLVKLLDGKFFEPRDIDEPYSYFVTDKMLLKGKTYKLIWLLEKDAVYIGVVNAYRR